MPIVKLNLSGHKNVLLEEQGYLFPGTLQVDLGDKDLPQKIVEFLKPHVASGDTVQVVLPGLAGFVPLVLAALHGLTGHFPVVIRLVKADEGFVPSEGFDLQGYRNGIVRTQRDDLIQL